MVKQTWPYYAAAVAIWLFEIILAYDPAKFAAAAQTYHLTPAAVALLAAAVQLPFLVCWLFAVAAWVYLRRYTINLPARTEQHRGYKLILWGLVILILSLVVPALMSALYTRVTGSGSGPVFTWLRVYSTLLFPLAGFFLASLGTRHLLVSLKLKAEPLVKSLTALIPLSVFGLLFIGIVFTNPVRYVSPNPAIAPTYYLPDALIILTIVVPVIITWAFGFRLALNLEQYSHYVPPQHKPALVNIYNGTLAIIGSVILQQVLSSFGSSRLTGLNLGLILALIYILLIVIGVGYALIVRGARQLVATTNNTPGEA